MNEKDAIEAARVIKEYCVANSDCHNCPFLDNDDGYKFCWFNGREDEPHQWKLPKEAQHDD